MDMGGYKWEGLRT